jgi:peptidylamidoglycolate lyase
MASRQRAKGLWLVACLLCGYVARSEQEQAAEEAFSGRLEAVEQWPVKDLELGQIGGIATDPEGYLHVIHRAGRPWTSDMFSADNVFTMKKDGPIKEPTLFKINSTNGIVLDKLGDDRFYIPHGLTIDSHGNKWMTDVAMHQVFKFEPGKKEPSLVLGKLFEPAKTHEDTERFCKPTDVGVASNGDIYVTDGYCASRIMKFDKTGKFLSQFGLDDFQIPHSIAVIEELDLICAADREGMRVLCYNAGIKDSSKLGEPEREYTDDTLGRVFAITYSPTDGVLYGVTGLSGILLPQGFTIDMKDDERYKTDIIAMWAPQEKGFDAPHDITVSPDGEAVFVGEITNGNPLWKFVKEQE